MQACKLYLGNLRANTRIAKIIRIHEEAIMIKYRQGKQKSNYNRRIKIKLFGQKKFIK